MICPCWLLPAPQVHLTIMSRECWGLEPLISRIRTVSTKSTKVPEDEKTCNSLRINPKIAVSLGGRALDGDVKHQMCD
jgi:hypothetical protein